MENIQMDEETRPLSAPPRRVAEAYAANTNANFLKKNAFWIGAFILFLLLSAGGNNDQSSQKKNKRAKKLRNQAEVAPSVEVQKQKDVMKNLELEEKQNQLLSIKQVDSIDEDIRFQQFTEGNPDYDTDDSSEDEEELELEIGSAMADVDQAEEEEIVINDSMLVSAVHSMEESAKFYLTRLFGYGEDDDDDDDDEVSSGETSADIKLTEEQLDMISKKISERLEEAVRRDFREKADAITEEKVDEIDQVVAEDRDADMSAREIANDVAELEKEAVDDLKDEIDDAAVRVKESLPEKMKTIRNEVVEEVTGKRVERIEERKRKKREKKKELLKQFQQLKGKLEEESGAKNVQQKGKSMENEYGKGSGGKQSKNEKRMYVDSEGEESRQKGTKEMRIDSSIETSDRNKNGPGTKKLARKKKNRDIDDEETDVESNDDSDDDTDDDQTRVSPARRDEYESEDEE